MKAVYIVLVLCLTSCTSVRRFYIKFPKVNYAVGPSSAFAEASNYEKQHAGIVSHVYETDGALLPHENLVVAEKIPYDVLEPGDVVVIETPTDWTIRVLKYRYSNGWALAGNPKQEEEMTQRNYIGVIRQCWTW